MGVQHCAAAVGSWPPFSLSFSPSLSLSHVFGFHRQQLDSSVASSTSSMVGSIESSLGAWSLPSAAYACLPVSSIVISVPLYLFDFFIVWRDLDSITLSGDERELGKVCVRVSYQEAVEQVWITLVQVRLPAATQRAPLWPLWMEPLWRRHNAPPERLLWLWPGTLDREKTCCFDFEGT